MTKKTPDKSRAVAEVEDEPPPFGGSWAILYAAVLATLGALILLFYLFTRSFR